MTRPALFRWNDTFSVGIQEIDDQHKTLFDLINRLFQAALERKDHAVSLEILDALIDYTKIHFALEERLLESAEYPDLPQHQLEHRKFEQELSAMAQKFLAEEKTITFELINFLKHWLKEHIMETDMAYASQLSQSEFSTDAWSADARQVFSSRYQGHSQKPWWKFWADPSIQTS